MMGAIGLGFEANIAGNNRSTDHVIWDYTDV